MFRKKRYVHPFISRKPVRTPLTYIQIDQICRIELGIFAVALCEEGVDRNMGGEIDLMPCGVALCEEGVDRNIRPDGTVVPVRGRPLRRGRG